MRTLLIFFILLPFQVLAATPSHCVALAENTPGVRYVALNGLETLEPDTVRIHFIDHATFIIETPLGQTIATDFTGLRDTNFVPTVVTMNNAHTSHFTSFPDQRIQHVLRGWGTGGKAADVYLRLEDLLIRNVTTDIRNPFAGQVPDGNSIFIFEVAGMCIGHLGHLHHELSDIQYGLIGRLDIVMVPIDGSTTMSQAAMIRVMNRLKARVVIPMHWFGRGNLERFVTGMYEDFKVERSGLNHMTMSFADLPRDPTIYVLEPVFMDDPIVTSP